MKWRNQLLALFCLLLFLLGGVFYFRNWVVQKPFGIILFIGEGLTPGRLAAARIYAGAADIPLTLDSLPHNALLRNYSADSATPDRAAAASALATGVKVKNGSLGVDAEGNALTNLMELARESGRMTGLVTDALLTGPTAAGFYAHRTAADDRADLARILIEKANIDVVLGGGWADFRPGEKGGRRTDGKDLIAEAQTAGYEVVETLAELEEIPRWRRAKLIGVFTPAEFPFTDEEARRENLPSLADMVRRAIELLQFNSGGYFLVVDAGLARKAAEANDGRRTLTETGQLDYAVSVALQYTGVKSAILVCGDVGLGGMTLSGSQPSPAKTEAGFGKMGPASFLTWATGPKGEQNPGVSEPPGPEIDSPPGGAFAPEVAAKYAPAAQNSADDVLALGAGLGTELLHGSMENTQIFEVIRDNL